MGQVLVRPLLAPAEESTPVEDGEGREDEDETLQAPHEEAEEGRRPLLRKSDNQPSSQEVQEHVKTHIPNRSWCAHCIRGKWRNGQCQVEEDVDHGTSRRTTLTNRQTRGAIRSS